MSDYQDPKNLEVVHDGGTVRVQPIVDQKEIDRENRKMPNQSGTFKATVDSHGNIDTRYEGNMSVTSGSEVEPGADIGSTCKKAGGFTSYVPQEQAIADPSGHLITVHGKETTLAAALAARLVAVNNGQIVPINENLPGTSEHSQRVAQEEKAVEQRSVVGKDGDLILNVGRRNDPYFDQKLAAAFHHTANQNDSAKAKNTLAAIAESLEVSTQAEARALVNAVTNSVHMAGYDAIENAYGNQGVSAYEYIFTNATGQVKANILHRLAIGDQSVLGEIMERNHNKNLG